MCNIPNPSHVSHPCVTFQLQFSTIYIYIRIYAYIHITKSSSQPVNAIVSTMATSLNDKMKTATFGYAVSDTVGENMFNYRCKSEICLFGYARLHYLHHGHDDCITEMIQNMKWWLFRDDYMYDYYMHAFMRTLEPDTNANKTQWMQNVRRLQQNLVPLPHSILMAYNTLFEGRYVHVRRHPYGYKVDPPKYHECWYNSDHCDICLLLHEEQHKLD